MKIKSGKERKTRRWQKGRKSWENKIAQKAGKGERIPSQGGGRWKGADINWLCGRGGLLDFGDSVRRAKIFSARRCLGEERDVGFVGERRDPSTEWDKFGLRRGLKPTVLDKKEDKAGNDNMPLQNS